MPPRFCENCGTAIEPGKRFCSECGQPVEESAPPAQPLIATPAAITAEPARPPMPTAAWMAIGLVVAGLVGGGLYFAFRPPADATPARTAAQQDSVREHILDDLPNRPSGIDLDAATNPKDLPPELQKTYDNSALSAKRAADIASALAPLPKIGGELINTKAAPTLSDDFSNPLSGWFVSEDDNAIRSYVDGRFEITFAGTQGSAQSGLRKNVGNFAFEIDATPIDGPANYWYGVILRQSAAQTFAVFMLHPQGLWMVSKRVNGVNTMVAAPARSDAIKPGLTTNRIKVYVVDQHFVFEVNGKTVDVESIDGLPAGRVGVIVARSPNNATTPVRVAYDNFRLWAAR